MSKVDLSTYQARFKVGDKVDIISGAPSLGIIGGVVSEGEIVSLPIIVEHLTSNVCYVVVTEAHYSLRFLGYLAVEEQYLRMREAE